MHKVELLPAQRLKGLIERSPDLAAIIELADSVGLFGRGMAMGLIQRRFDAVAVPDRPDTPAWQPTAAMVAYKAQKGS
jgi:hypothetical protein